MAKECDQLNNALSAGFIPRAYRRMCVKMLSASLSINKNPFVCTKMCGKQQEAAAAAGAGSREQGAGAGSKSWNRSGGHELLRLTGKVCTHTRHGGSSAAVIERCQVPGKQLETRVREKERKKRTERQGGR